MTPHPLAFLIPSSNILSLPMMCGQMAGAALQAAYDYKPEGNVDLLGSGSSFVGAFCDHEDMPTWARRIARWNKDQFHDEMGKKFGGNTLFSDIASELTESGDGLSLPNFRYALEQWEAGGRVGPEPYTAQQDYGSCVDASTTELLTALEGWRAAQAANNEVFYRSVAWYFYGERGYCSDGWSFSGLAPVAMRTGIAFREVNTFGSGSVDFTDDDANERYVARTICRSGLPDGLVSKTQAAHPFEDGAMTEFNGDVAGMKKVFAAGGGFNTGGTNTSGGHKPFTVGRVGGHEQSIVGMDDSEDYRKFCRDKIGVALPDDDIAVVFNQTWGPGFAGECGDEFWPTHLWGKKPQGAWVWRGSQVLRYFDGDIWSVLPRFKGTPSNLPPVPPQPLPPGPNPQPVNSPIIDGVLSLTGGDGKTYRYVVVPKTEL